MRSASEARSVTRRAALAAAVGFAVAHAADAHAADARAAEQSLAGADLAASIATLEAKAASSHDPQVEIALVRARMQAGDYRLALSFAAHVAGEHLDSAAGGVLYAWLLRVGGQRAVADRVVAEMQSRLPGDPLVGEVAQALASPLPVASGALLEPPQRVAPDVVETGGAEAIPGDARIVSSAVLFAGGARALAPAKALEQALTTRLWVRNALGQASPVEVDRSSAGPDVVVLRLMSTMDPNGADRQAERDPFAGSPGFAIEYAQAQPARPAWPQLSEGFLGRPVGSAGLRRLGIEVPEATSGGPVLDGSGRLAGIVLRDSGGAPMLRPVSTWPTFAPKTSQTGQGEAKAPVIAPAANTRMPAAEAYERGMRIALQVIAAP